MKLILEHRKQKYWVITPRRYKKVLSDSPALVKQPVGLVYFYCSLPDGQATFIAFDSSQIKVNVRNILEM